MFGLTGVMKFYYMPSVTDMRLGYARLSEIVKLQYGREPRNGDVYMFISRDRRRIRLFRYECEAYYLYEKYFDRGLSFMKIEYTDEQQEISARQIKRLQEKSAEQIKISQEKSAAEIKTLRNELSSFRLSMERLIANKDAELQLLRTQLFGKKSLKGRRPKSRKGQDDDQDRDKFDGTPESISNRSNDK